MMSSQAPKPIRSPAYPNMSLNDAIQAVKKIEALYRQSPVDREAGAKLIGYSSLSGPANAALAALAQYGLVERAGKGEMRVTPRAKAILHPDNDEEKRQHLRLAGLEPKLFKELYERWPGMIPPEDGVTTYLNRQGFNSTAIRPATKAYLQTLHFLEESGASESHGGEQKGGADSGAPQGDGDAVTYGGARVGDMVDYEAGGAIANPEPMRIRHVSPDQAWVFVDGSETGLEMEHVIVRERGDSPDPPVQRPTLPLPKGESLDEQIKPGSRKAIFPISDGDVALVFPENISADGLETLGMYLDIFLKKEIQKKG